MRQQSSYCSTEVQEVKQTLQQQLNLVPCDICTARSSNITMLLIVRIVMLDDGGGPRRVGGWMDPSQLTNGRASLVPSADLLVLQSADVRKVLAGC